MERFRSRISNGRLTIQNVEIRMKGGRTVEKGVKHVVVTEAHSPTEQRFMASGKEFAAGDVVAIVDGPFRDRVVLVQEIRGPMARILMSLFGDERELDVAGCRVIGQSEMGLPPYSSFCVSEAIRARRA